LVDACSMMLLGVVNTMFKAVWVGSLLLRLKLLSLLFWDLKFRNKLLWADADDDWKAWHNVNDDACWERFSEFRRRIQWMNIMFWIVNILEIFKALLRLFFIIRFRHRLRFILKFVVYVYPIRGIRILIIFFFDDLRLLPKEKTVLAIRILFVSVLLLVLRITEREVRYSGL
jgi:hypothetical protein